MPPSYIHYKRRSKQMARDLALRAGYSPVPATDHHRFYSLVAELRPVQVAGDFVRLGGDHDGGYVVPDDFSGPLVAISPGVATEVSFDEALAARGIDVHMFDASVPEAPVSNPRFHFEPVHLDSFDSPRTVTLDTIVNRLPIDHDLILEMDIEGAEYRIIHSLSDTALRRFRIMVIEFHSLCDLTTAARFDDLASAFRKILRHHYIVHAHPNNGGPRYRFAGITVPDVCELTLLRKDRATLLPGPPRLPHPLDQDCSVEYPPIPVPSPWR